MIAYPHVRRPERLEELYTASLLDLARCNSDLGRLMILAKTVSYHYALEHHADSPGADMLRHYYATALGPTLRRRSLAPELFLVLCGLGAYLQTAHRAALFDVDARFWLEHEPSYGRNVLNLWASLTEAVCARANGDGERALQALERVTSGARATRLNRETYFTLTSLCGLMNALILGQGVAGAWRTREMHVFTMTAKRGDLYHPAGLLDLHALAIVDVAGGNEGSQSAFVPTLASWTTRSESSATGF